MPPISRVVMVDWSASSTVGPARPAPDRCWLAWADTSHPSTSRPAPEYFRTRLACEVRLRHLIDEHAHPSRPHTPTFGAMLIGLDFPLGYPRSHTGDPPLPRERELCRHLASHITDSADARNNRFEVAAEINRHILTTTNADDGPFWGVPHGHTYPGLTPTKPRRTGIQEFRPVEQLLRARGHNIRSPWQLTGAGAVGSQMLLGLPMVSRLLDHAGTRARLWPFETIDRPDAIIFAEIWPSLAPHHAPRYANLPIKDARQVAAMRDWALESPTQTAASLSWPRRARNATDVRDGWILGVDPDPA